MVNPAELFGELLKQREFVLHKGALCIAAHAYPDMDFQLEMDKVGALADQCDGRNRESMLHSLFSKLGFHGNQADYYDPRNSFLNEVMHRRTGIPISLGVLTIAVGQQLGFNFEGIGMPGHFLLQDTQEPEIFIDVFAGGTLLSTQGCQEMFSQMSATKNVLHPAHLAPVNHASIMERMLGNLRAIYAQRRDYANLLWVLELRLMCPTASPSEARQVGLVLMEQGRFDEAARRFELLAETVDGQRGGTVGKAGRGRQPKEAENPADELHRLATLARARMN